MNFRYKPFTVKIFIAPIILFLLGFGVSGLKAQTQPDIPKKIHVDTLDNIYIHKDLPVLFFMSPHADGKDAIQLKAIDRLQTPFTFPRGGLQQLTHNDLQLGKLIRFPLKIDARAPATEWKVTRGQYTMKDGMMLASGGVSIELNATAGMAPVADVFYTQNGQNFTEYTQPIVLDNEAQYSIVYFAASVTGQKESIKKLEIIVDATPPVTTKEFQGDVHEDVISGRTRIILSAEDATGVENIYYRLNDADFRAYRRPISSANLQEGYHTLEFYAKDIVGNKEETHSSRFFVDKTPPVIMEEISGNSFISGGREFSSGRSRLRLAAIDNKAGVKAIYYSINDEEYQKYESPVLLSAFSGTINISAYAVDNVNNTSEGGAQAARHNVPYVDLNAPRISHKVLGPKITLQDTLLVSPQTRFQLNAVDRESGLSHISFSINGGTHEQYSQAFTLETEGYTAIQYFAYDNVENMNTDEFFVFVDTQGPEIEAVFSIRSFGKQNDQGRSLDVYPDHVQLFLSATDTHAGTQSIVYSLNGGRETKYGGSVTGFIKQSANELKIIAQDTLGNKSEKTIRFFVK